MSLSCTPLHLPWPLSSEESRAISRIQREEERKKCASDAEERQQEVERRRQELEEQLWTAKAQEAAGGCLSTSLPPGPSECGWGEELYGYGAAIGDRLPHCGISSDFSLHFTILFRTRTCCACMRAVLLSRARCVLCVYMHGACAG